MKRPAVWIILFNAAAVVISYGRIIEVKGILSFALWAAVIVFNIVYIKKRLSDKHKLKAAVIACMILYVLAGALFALREYTSARTVKGEYTNGSEYIVAYELNAGAMSHISYEKRTYFNIADTPLIKVRLLKEDNFYDSFG